MNPDLPIHLISKILLHTDLEIDTRRALRMRPGPVKRLISTNAHTALAHLFEQRSNAWARFAQNQKAGGNTSCLLADNLIFMYVSYTYERILMQFQKIMFVEPRPRFVQRFVDDSDLDLEEEKSSPRLILQFYYTAPILFSSTWFLFENKSLDCSRHRPPLTLGGHLAR